MFHGPQLENIGIFFSLQIHLKLISQRTKQKKKKQKMYAHIRVFVYIILYWFHQHLMKTHYVSDTVRGTEYINSKGKLEQIITQKIAPSSWS